MVAGRGCRPAADGLETGAAAAHRDRLVEALGGVVEHLLAHLAFEEEAIGPTLSRWHGLREAIRCVRKGART